MDYGTFLKQAEGILDAEPWYVAAMSSLSAPARLIEEKIRRD